jgi:exonuclease VII small subunit
MKMAVVQNVKNSCDNVLTSVRDSSLNFSLQETPFSIYITIRKSFLRCRSDSLDKNPSNYKEEQTSGKSQELEDLITKLKSEEKSNLALKNNYEEAIEDSAKCYQRIQDLENQVERLRDSLD